MLNTGRTVEHWHTRTKTGDGADPRAPVAERLAGDESARRARAAADARTTAWTSSRGAAACSGVELRLTEIVAPGQVFMPFHYVEANANQADAERVRPDLARAELQAVRGARRADAR